MEKERARCIPLEELKRLLEETYFACGGKIVPVDEVLQGLAYLDSRGPLEKAWRDGDSTWSLVTPEELERAGKRIREMDASGTLTEYVSRQDARRPRIGQTTFLYGRR